ncbi:alpha-glucuronidase family glycosyl hydrolase [Prevotella rectalis]|uniref:alpha-glucuronidase family glycosyl hydrolase n=1 Tax=Prevotella rectalis TaxID=2219999 RepID=UPI001030A89F|nr:alpha-glucuronidase family glycosyl hydrolase [Prevotella brunnea]
MILHLLNIKELRLLTALFLTLFPLSLLADNYLFKDGKSDYIIICNAPKGSSEYTSAMEMQAYIQKMNGVMLPINPKEQTNKKHIYIGYNKELRKLGIKQPSDSNEGFVYKTIGEDLYIFGGKQLGTMYGVFSFLEDQLGIHWYTKDYVKIPKLTQWTLPSMLSVIEKPAFKYRHVFFYTSRINHDWNAHNKLNTTMGLNIKNYYCPLNIPHFL